MLIDFDPPHFCATAQVRVPSLFNKPPPPPYRWSCEILSTSLAPKLPTSPTPGYRAVGHILSLFCRTSPLFHLHLPQLPLGRNSAPRTLIC